MSFKTWEAIAKRHVWYRTLLLAKMKEWPEERIYASTDLVVLKRVVGFGDRVERHEQRMERHMQRGLAALEAPNTERH